jgi:hypothetical protein
MPAPRFGLLCGFCCLIWPFRRNKSAAPVKARAANLN